MLDCLDVNNESSLPSGIITRISLRNNTTTSSAKAQSCKDSKATARKCKTDTMNKSTTVHPVDSSMEKRPVPDGEANSLAILLASWKKQFKLLTKQLTVIEGSSPATAELKPTLLSVVVKLAVIAVVFCSGLSLVPFLFMLLYFTCFSIAVCLFIVTVILASAGLCGFILILFGCLPIAVIATINRQ